MKMEELLAKLQDINPNFESLAIKYEALIRIINEIEPKVFDRIKLDENGNPVKR